MTTTPTKPTPERDTPKHTPGPLKVNEYRSDKLLLCITSADETANVASVYRGPSEDVAQANAARLVHCWNHFDTLIEALNKIACWSEGPEVSGHFDEPGSASIARAALAKAKP